MAASIADAIAMIIGEEEVARRASLDDFDFYSPSLDASRALSKLRLPVVYLDTLLLLKQLKSVGHFVLLQQNSERLPPEGASLPWAEDRDRVLDETKEAMELDACWMIMPAGRGIIMRYNWYTPDFGIDYRTVMAESIRDDCALLEQDVEIFRIRDPSYVVKMAKDAVDVYRRFISHLIEYALWILRRFAKVFRDSTIIIGQSTIVLELRGQLSDLATSLDVLSTSKKVADNAKAKKGDKLLQDAVDLLERIRREPDLSVQKYRRLALDQHDKSVRLRDDYIHRRRILMLTYNRTKPPKYPLQDWERDYPFKDWKRDVITQYAEGNLEERDERRELAENVATIEDLGYMLNAATDREEHLQDVVDALARFERHRALPHAVSLLELLKRSLAVEAAGCANMVNASYLAEHGHKEKVRALTRVDTGTKDDIVTVDWVSNFYSTVVRDLDPHGSVNLVRTDYSSLMDDYLRDGNRHGLEGWEFLSRVNDSVHDYASHIREH